MNNTPTSNRIHIGIFGKTNVGKSSIINLLTGQEHAIVSSIAGTTTDPVSKTMELLPLGPVVFIDTAGIDDTSSLSKKRIDKTYDIIDKVDIAIVVVQANSEIGELEKDLIDKLELQETPYLVVYNKSDLVDTRSFKKDACVVSTLNNTGIQELKDAIIQIAPVNIQKYPIISDLINQGDVVVLVIPIDSAAPKGRIILPQQQTLREILEVGATSLVCKETELEDTLLLLKDKPALVVTDSQVFDYVSKIVPSTIKLTSFSILFARHKGSLHQYVKGLEKLDTLEDNDTILIVEGCTHHRQCDDIGTVKIPKWVNEYTGKKINFEFNSGHMFEKDLSKYKMIVHCGGCMLTAKVVQNRQSRAKKQAVPITNYGTLIAKVTGILERSLEPIKF